LALLLGGITTIIICFSSQQVSKWFLRDAIYSDYFFAGAFLIPFQIALQINLNLFRGLGRIKFFAFQSLALSIIETFAICLYITFNPFLLGLIWLLVAIRGLFAFFQFCYIGVTLGFAKPRYNLIKSAIKYSLPLLPSGMSVWITDRVDRLFIGAMIGPVGLGIYSACYTFANTIMLLVTPFQTTLLPYVSAAWDSSRELVTQYLNLSIKIFIRLAMPAILFLTFTSVDFLNLLGNQEIARHSRILVLFISAGLALWGTGIFFGIVLHGAKKTYHIGAIRLVTAILNILLNATLIPLLQLQGAALATLLSYGVAAFLLWFFANKHLAIDISSLYVLKVAIAIGCMGLSFFILPNDSIFFLALKLLTGGVIYLLLLFALNLIDTSEKNYLRRLFRDKILTNIY